MILLLSNERDLTTDYIVRELQRRRLPYWRLNSERLAEASVQFRPTGPHSGWVVELAGKRMCLAQVTAGYFRRPAMPLVSSPVTPAHAKYCQQEWLAVLHAIYRAVGDRWLNTPTQIEKAENKANQLELANALGFQVPETLISNHPATVKTFVEKGDVVAKPFRSGLISTPSEQADEVIFTTRISDQAWTWMDGAIEAVPVIYQREVPKRCDIRATVVGHSVFAAQIQSQERTETQTDWRRDEHADLAHAPHTLPKDVEGLCAEFIRRQGLRFAAIDLVLDRSGRYWFLEANPNGQWAWVETRTGLPIAAAIVDELLNIGASNP